MFIMSSVFILSLVSNAFSQEISCADLKPHKVYYHCEHEVGEETANACTEEAQTAKSLAFKKCAMKFSLHDCIINKSQCQILVSDEKQDVLSCQALLGFHKTWNLKLTAESRRRCL